MTNTYADKAEEHVDRVETRLNDIHNGHPFKEGTDHHEFIDANLRIAAIYATLATKHGGHDNQDS